MVLIQFLFNIKNNLDGDWVLTNLIYSIKDNIIYNIDLEGFFSYKKPRKCLMNNVGWITERLKETNINILNTIKKYV